MRIAICDDEINFTNRLQEFIKNKYRSLDMLIECFNSGEELVRYYKKGKPDFDIIFLDIEMNKMNGLEAARIIHEFDSEVMIIFVTSHDELACSGYEVSAYRYLTKPLDTKKLLNAIESAISLISQSKTILVKNEDGEFKIRLADILYIESLNQQVAIHTASNQYTIRHNISDYTEHLVPEGFILSHRSYLVNMKYIKGFNQQEVMLESGAVIPVSRLRIKNFKEAFHQYLNRTAF